jgi:predicted nucleic acid-binding protein
MVPSLRAPRVYFDVNVFIAAFENRGARSDHAWWLLSAVERGDLVGVTSELTLAELLVKPMLEQDGDLVHHYKELITPGEGFEVPVVSRDVLIEAAALRTVRLSLRLPDAVHVASARLSHCVAIVSDDRRLPFAPGLNLVQLGPHALQAIQHGTR